MTAASVLSDDQLAQAFAGRENDALAEAYRRYVDVLNAVARSIVGGADDARDCVHDVVLRVWLSAHAYRTDRGTLRSFLIVCVRNEALSRRRSAARHLDLERREARLSADNDTEREMIDTVEHGRLHAALQSLPHDQRVVLELAYFGARTQSEIADQLGIPLGTVKSRASLALRKLALLLGPAQT